MARTTHRSGDTAPDQGGIEPPGGHAETAVAPEETLTRQLADAHRRSRLEREEMERKLAGWEETTRILLAADDAQGARIARMLHDNVGQYVAALQLGLRGLEHELDSGRDAKLTLRSLHAITENVGAELHKVALELRPTSLDDHGLVPALMTFIAEWSLLNRTTVDFDHAAVGESRFPSQLETNLFRIIRDMLHVVAQQTEVGRVSVILGRQLERVVAIVEHDGQPPAGGSARAGDEALASIEARLTFLEGTLTVENGTPRGRTMIARVPGSRSR